ncbi:hypothetical protein MPSI1_003970 [Malassezia psittaci]|uniref:Sodium/calcium exchanger membrane region domain-containing protein n=1 Tax=Malassezia psittaci TaxID=1821823 RepID=A0AAF0F9U4_9BASI|nr:hypothetical protein MPSI1_003970 [Malassezia psittaci]
MPFIRPDRGDAKTSMRSALVVCALGVFTACVAAVSIEDVHSIQSCPILPENLTLSDACAFVKSECAESPSLFYLRLYYCVEAYVSPNKPTANGVVNMTGLFALLISLFFLFSVLGLVAGDFFCPNLSSLAAELGMNDSTVGVTLLAFGNGLPDVVSTFRAMQQDSATIALGELMGAAVFTVSAVCGSIMVFHRFYIHPFLFARDVGVYCIAVLLMLYFMRDGCLQLHEGITLILLYAVFLVLVFVGDLYVDPQLGVEAADVERISEQTPLVGEPTMWTRYDVGARQRSLSPTGSHDRVNKAAAHNPHTLPSSTSETPGLQRKPLFRRTSLPVWYGSESYDRDMLRSISPDANVLMDEYFDNNRTVQRGPLVRIRDQLSRKLGKLASHHHSPERDTGIARSQSSSSPKRTISEESPLQAPQIQIVRPSVDLSAGFSAEQDEPNTNMWTLRILGIALFPSLMCWQNRTVLQKVLSSLAAPALLLLRATVPLVSKEEYVFHKALAHLLHASSREQSPTASVLDVCHELEEQPDSLSDTRFLIQTDERAQADRWLIGIQCVLTPPFILTALGFPQDPFVRHLVMIGSALVGIIAGYHIARHFSRFPDCNTPEQLQRYSFLRSGIGFCIGLLWIVVCVDQVLALLHALGYICGWSEAILGLTLFAIGNSLGDIVTNLSIARLGHPLMALSACFASPMTNLLLGVGVSTTWIRLAHPEHGAFFFSQSTTLLLSSCALAAMLLSMLIVIPLNGLYTCRTLGLLFLATYVVVMSANIFLEMHSSM